MKLATAALALALAFGAGAAQAQAAVTPTTAGAAQATDPLSAERFAALDAALSAFVTFLDSTSQGDFSDAALATMTQACNALGRSDRLLSVNRRGCLLATKLVDAFIAQFTCLGRTRCLRATSRTVSLVAQSIVLDRELNRIVAQEVPAGACRNELRASAKDVADNRRLLSALRQLERALRTKDLVAQRRAQRRLDRIFASADDGLTPAEEVERFRNACRPASPPSAS